MLNDLKRPIEDIQPEPLLLLSAEGEVIDSNLAARRIFPSIAQGGRLEDLVEGDPAKVRESLQVWLRNGSLARGLVSLVGNDGTRYATYGARTRYGDGEPAQLLLRCEVTQSVNRRFIELTRRINELNWEVSRRKRVEGMLAAEKEWLRVTLHSIGDGVITTDIEGRVTYLNPMAEALTGWADADASGKPLLTVFRIADEYSGEPVEGPVARVLKEGAIQTLGNHTVLTHSDGSEFSIEDSAAPIRDSDGSILGVVLVFHDVTETRRLNAKLSHQATHDCLTGLFNRKAFEQRLQEVLRSPETRDRPHSLLFLDLDHFKLINDTGGHIAGDAVLRALGPVLEHHMRQSDMLARLGGDEFAVLLQNCPPDVAETIAAKLQQAIMEFNFAWEGKPCNVGVSIGQVNFSDGGWSMVELLSAADRACYIAKDSGRNRIHVYGSDDSELAHRHGQMEWVGEIRKALREDRFRLFYQPIVSVKEKRADQHGIMPSHCELLLRLYDPKRGFLSPRSFIPAAERYDLMGMVDRWVLEAAFSRLARLDCADIDTCAINLSGASLGDGQFLQFVFDLFERYPVSPKRICFEITETAAIANLKNAQHMIGALRQLGCFFALDDFGSGMSSFGYLKYLHVDYLKIDGDFVKDMLEDPVDRVMVESIHHIGHVMGLKTIAEFVENDRVLEQLNVLGIDHAQGFGIARPQSFDDLLGELA
ncbi:EAL domain-containing protein [Vreelandella utahensis]|uniref:EAL domain-containing protein n=1 Tax=Vreelandella halophila TaxID=86177 RepID=UPI0015C36812|nr:EAL domain-containing protein [Halomonas utahensis]